MESAEIGQRPGTRERPFAVGELTERIKNLLEGQIGAVWVEGELSNVQRAASGHLYFSLKDASGQIDAVMFRGQQRGLAFEPVNGTVARVFGSLSVYAPRGRYQIVAREMAEGGKGSRFEQFEALKTKLAAEGLFDEKRKRPIPLLPRHIGLVTSRSGAALRDILNVLFRRFPNIRLVLAPTRVQGEGAAAEIAAGIDALNRLGGLDVLIVARGGGSAEDLWCFNEEPVARAVAASRLPVISAVGHETDFTLCDFAADLRAPTPSAAAELVVGQKERFVEKLDGARGRMAQALRLSATAARARFERAARSSVFKEPAHLVTRERERVRRFRDSIRRALESRFFEARQRADESAGNLAAAAQRVMARLKTRWITSSAKLVAMDPLAVLSRGYAVIRRPDGRIVRKASEVSPNDILLILVSEGIIASVVTNAATPDKRSNGHERTD